MQTSQPAWNSYESALGKIILRSRAAKSLPALSLGEFNLAVEAFAEICGGEIPLDDLEHAYIRAMRDSEKGFAPGADDLVRGHRANCASEAASPRPAQDRNLLPGEVCKKCFGSGWEQFTEGGYKQVRKCDHVVEGFIGPPDPDSDVDLW